MQTVATAAPVVHSSDRAWDLGYVEGLADRHPSIPYHFSWPQSKSYIEGWRAGDAERICLAADRLAWLNDSADNHVEDYPGPGWDEDWATLYEGDPGDGQFCPLDIEYWSLPAAEYHQAEAEFEAWAEDEINWSLSRRVAVGDGVAS